jgi:predicted methyltransferase
MFNLAGHLYSAEYYRELHRVLKRGGRLFHYIGDLRSKSGRNVAKSAARRLQEAGFKAVKRRPEAFGLLAFR